ncbi:MAG: hypothetical protein HFE30_08670 [Clostridiales bacterium]|nr:hypothetical protein [Clostridiales bacterium]
MSVQNTLKKPAFTKSVRGYTVQEVDRYIEYVNERYAAVCRDVAELKRKLTRLKLGLDRPEAEANTANVDVLPEELLKHLENLRRELSAECERHAEHMKRLSRDFENETLNTVSTKINAEVGASILKNTAVQSLNELAVNEVAALEAEPISAEECNSSDGALPESESPVEIGEDDGSLKETAELTEDGTSEDGNDNTEEKTPAQLAEEIDFYSDGVHADGESFDPMDFAADAAAKYARPSFASLMGGDPEK